MLSELIENIPGEEVQKPTEEHIAVLKRFKEWINQNEISYSQLVEAEQGVSKKGWSISEVPDHWRNEKLIGQLVKNLDETLEDREEVQRVCDLRRQYIIDCLGLEEADKELENGGVKSEIRIVDKMRRIQELDFPRYIGDLTRVRIVCDGLQELESLYISLREQLSGVLNLCVISNYYNASKVKNQRPWRGLNTVWVSERYPNIPTEIQLVTRRVRAVMNLDHPYTKAGICKYPSAGHELFMRQLMIVASLFDFRELNKLLV